VEVVSTSPLKASIVEWDEYVGRLEPTDFIEVHARVSGYLDETHFQEGQLVQEGDLLAVIDPRPFAAEVARNKADVLAARSRIEQARATVEQVASEVRVAEARYDLAQKQRGRSQRLLAQKVIPLDDFDVVESELQQAKATVESVKARLELARTAQHSAEADAEAAGSLLKIAELNLEYTSVRAPVTGRISSRLVTEGNLIIGGTAQPTKMTTIVSLDPIYTVFDADEQSFLKYTRLAREGKRQSSRDAKNPVYVSLGDEPHHFPHQGHMDFVDNRLDPETSTMRGRAILPNPDLSLTPGMFTRVRLPGSGQYEAILIPDQAVGTDQSEKFVFVIDRLDTVRRQTVELGPIVRGLRVVRHGLDGSERIVLRGLQRVQPGVIVQAQPENIALQDDGLPLEATPIPQERWLSRPIRIGRRARQ
jgi:RND family efflux transporter MFP subunit